MSDYSKAEKLVQYIIGGFENASITTLIKACYLIDHVHVKRFGRQITDFKYIRFYYGPFDRRIYNVVEKLLEDNKISAKHEYSVSGTESMRYFLNDSSQADLNDFDEDEVQSIQDIQEKVSGLGAKVLTEIAYKTKPMTSIGATLGGSESLGQILDLTA